MLEKRHDRVVEMRLCFFLGKVGDYKVSLVATRMCRSTICVGYAPYFAERTRKLPMLIISVARGIIWMYHRITDKRKSQR